MKFISNNINVFNKKDLIGFLISPLIICLLLLTPVIIEVVLKTPNVGNPSNVIILTFGAFFVAPLLYILMIVVAVPTVFILKKRKIYSYKAFSISGLIIGMTLSFFISSDLARPGDSTFMLLVFVSIGAVLGVIGFSCFWLIAIKNLPNQTLDSSAG